MPNQPQLIYLEPDDEITSVVRRLRAAEGSSVVIVAPGRSRATSSAVALRLLAQVAAEEKRSVSLVADAPTRAVAGEAGIAAFASVAEATSGIVAPDQGAATPRAPIHVVRGIPDGAVTTAAPADSPAPPVQRSGAGDETMAVRTQPKATTGSGERKRRRSLVPTWPWLTGLLVIFLAAGAALLPGATVRITPATVAVGPISIPVAVDITGHVADELEATKPGTATGERLEATPATGTVTFFNWNTYNVAVPQGTPVSVAGTTAFVTLQRIVVAKARSFTNPGQKSVAVAAVEPGNVGNVTARAIDTIDDDSVRILLRGFDVNPNRLVVNDEPTSGGLETSHPVIQQSDIDAVVAAIEADLRQQLDDALAGEPDRLYAEASDSEVPVVDVPDELVGTEDRPTFELSGTLSLDRAYASRTAAEATASSALLTLGNAVPAGTAIVVDSIKVELAPATGAGDLLRVVASVTATAAVAFDHAQLRDRIAGLTVDEARTELSPFGEIDVDLWPAWVDRLPRLTFRIDIKEEVRPAGESPDESPTQRPSP